MVFTPAPDRLLSESHEALHHAPGAPSSKEGAISPSLNPVSASSLIDTAEGLGPMSGRACDSYIKHRVSRRRPKSTIRPTPDPMGIRYGHVESDQKGNGYKDEDYFGFHGVTSTPRRCGTSLLMEMRHYTVH